MACGECTHVSKPAGQYIENVLSESIFNTLVHKFYTPVLRSFYTVLLCSSCCNKSVSGKEEQGHDNLLNYKDAGKKIKLCTAGRLQNWDKNMFFLLLNQHYMSYMKVFMFLVLIFTEILILPFQFDNWLVSEVVK